MDQPDIVIKNQKDWKFFRDNKLDMIVDPMVFRTIDIFLRGRDGAGDSFPDKDTDEIWKALSANIDSLAAFFDAFILSERLPIIDYGYTFDSHIGYNTRSLAERINTVADDHPLFSVHVMDDASSIARQAAITALKDRPSAPTDLTRDILQELSAFDYAWKPPEISASGAMSEEEENLTRFVYGGLLFSSFAQLARVDHLLQPKRARLNTALALQAAKASYDHERELFETLKQKTRGKSGISPGFFEMERLPQFLPYLLWKDPATPVDLLNEAVRLRKEHELQDYRKWRAEVLHEWRTKKRFDPATVAKLESAVRKAEQKFQPGGNFTLDLSANLSLTGIGLGPSAQIPAGKIWGWILEQLPGRRYTKLLMRLRLAETTYGHIETHLHSIWENE